MVDVDVYNEGMEGFPRLWLTVPFPDLDRLVASLLAGVPVEVAIKVRKIPREFCRDLRAP